jgi:hypothetical protein
MKHCVRWFVPIILVFLEVDTGRSQVQGQPGKISTTLSQKQNEKQTKSDRMVECLPSRCKSLDSVPSTEKKEKYLFL